MEKTMYRMMLLLVLSSLGVMGGCGKLRVTVPEDIGDKGILVGEVESDQWDGIKNSRPTIRNERGEGKQSEEYRGGIKEGRLLIPLEPGEYTLDTLYKTVSYQTIDYGRTQLRRIRYFEVNKKFVIEAGKATNIGKVVFEPVERTPLKRIPVFLDNTKETESYLTERHPGLYASLRDEKVINDIQTSVSKSLMDEVKKHYVLRATTSSWWQHEHKDDYIVSAKAGTLAKIKKSKVGIVSVSKIYDTGTVLDLSRCSVHADRAACVLSGRTVLLLDRGKVVKKETPTEALLNTAFVFGKSGVVLIDDNGKIYSSRNNGDSWSEFDGAILKKPIVRSAYDTHDMNSFGFHLGEKGYYIFEKGAGGDTTPFVYGKYVRDEYKLIELPKSVNNVQQVIETARGLVVGPASTSLSDDSIHVMMSDTQKWNEKKLPVSDCRKIAVLDYNGEHIEVSCHGDYGQESMDGGSTWEEKANRFMVFGE